MAVKLLLKRDGFIKSVTENELLNSYGTKTEVLVDVIDSINSIKKAVKPTNPYCGSVISNDASFYAYDDNLITKRNLIGLLTNWR